MGCVWFVGCVWVRGVRAVCVDVCGVGGVCGVCRVCVLCVGCVGCVCGVCVWGMCVYVCGCHNNNVIKNNSSTNISFVTKFFCEH